MDITIPNSVYIDGQWATATWLAEIADPATGELIITATINQPTRVAALRMNMDLARRLRAMAMQQMPEPGCYDCRTTGERLAALEARLDFLSNQFFTAMERVDAGLPGAHNMRNLYDAENDAAIVSYWDMQLLNMIETVNGRLGIVAGGA